MKRYIIFLGFFFFISFSLTAQRWIPSDRGFHLKGGWGDGYIYTKDKNLCFYSSLGYTTFLKNGLKWGLDLEYFQKNYCYETKNIPSVQFLLNISLSKNVWHNRSSDFFLNLGLAFHTGYETINWNKKTMLDGATLVHDDRVLYGTSLHIEFETFVTDRIIFQIHCKERINNSTVHKFHFLTGVGIKFLI